MSATAVLEKGFLTKKENESVPSITRSNHNFQNFFYFEELFVNGRTYQGATSWKPQAC